MIWIPSLKFTLHHTSLLSRGTLCLLTEISANEQLAIAIDPSPW